METYLHGKIDKPMAMLIGTWDPLLTFQLDLIGELVDFARTSGTTPAVVMLSPNPTVFIQRQTPPVFDDPDYRLACFRARGVEAILLLRLREEDLAAGFREFYAELSKSGTLRHLWMHEHQSLGRGPTGSLTFIERFGQQAGFTLRRLRHDMGVRVEKGDVGRQLRAGALGAAIATVGRAPVWRRPEQHFIKITGWRRGSYLAAPLADPFAESPTLAAPLRVHVGGLLADKAYIEWPDAEVLWLRFLGRAE